MPLASSCTASRFENVVLPDEDGPAISTSFVRESRLCDLEAMEAMPCSCRASATSMISFARPAVIAVLSEPTSSSPSRRSVVRRIRERRRPASGTRRPAPAPCSAAAGNAAENRARSTAARTTSGSRPTASCTRGSSRGSRTARTAPGSPCAGAAAGAPCRPRPGCGTSRLPRRAAPAACRWARPGATISRIRSWICREFVRSELAAGPPPRSSSRRTSPSGRQ